MSAPEPRLTFVIGGARSGKSRFAETLIETHAPPWTYVATAQAFDDEMADRIATHQARRDGRWTTRDAPHDLAAQIVATPDSPMLVDCLTLWLSNRLLADAPLEAEGDALVLALKARTAPTIVVSNEVGLGLVPETPLGRAFRDAAGRLNQKVAAAADAVHFVAAGLPLRMK
jgi:adenosylcobinamide kinase/adenosylcobinamide-phosphate guanylyltransferase